MQAIPVVIFGGLVVLVGVDAVWILRMKWARHPFRRWLQSTDCYRRCGRAQSTQSLATMPRSDARARFLAVLDQYVGLCILAAYFLYLKLVKSALSVFDCTLNKDGENILDADPSVVCGQVPPMLLGKQAFCQVCSACWKASRVPFDDVRGGDW